MQDADRFKLLGKYKTPRFRVGCVVLCEVRGEVVITGMTDASIPWPLGLPGRGRHSLIVYKDLARAVRRESNQAVAHHWGVDPQTVSKWRKLLSVHRINEGSRQLCREHIAETGDEMRALGVLKARDPERRAKIAAAHCGKPRPRHIIEAMRQARLGSHHREEARQKMSRTHQARGTLVPGTKVWTPQEDEMVRTLPVEEAVKKTGRSLSAVYARRSLLQLPDGRRRER